MDISKIKDLLLTRLYLISLIKINYYIAKL